MKEVVQRQTNGGAHHEESMEGKSGGSMSPPAFSLQASPVQMKEKDEEPAQDFSHLSKQGQFVAKFAPGAVALEKQHGVPAVFTLAQGAIESGWGDKAIGNALFGIKANKSWKGKKQLVTTHEYHKDDKQGHRYPEVISITKVREGRYKYKVKDHFRDYDTVQEGLADHSNFLLVNKRYKGAFNTETPEEFAKAVAAAGYATSPTYADLLISVIKSVRKHWPKEAGAIPTGNAKSITGGTPGGSGTTGKDSPGGQPSGGTKEDPKGATNQGGAATGGSSTIQGAVGSKSPNSEKDALVIKELMIKAGYDLKMIPAIGPKTIGYIKDFQTKTFGWQNPDGVIDPGGKTFKALVRAAGGQANETKGTADPKEDKATPKASTMDYPSMAEKLHSAMAGMGTDEQTVYNTLAKLKRDAKHIDALKKAYREKYGSNLVSDINGDFSNSWAFGNQLDKALGYLNAKPAAGETKPKGSSTKPKEGGKETTTGPKGNAKGDTGDKLDAFFADFSNIPVTHGEKTIKVVPPYHINAGHRKDKALASRKASSAVTKLISDLKKSKKVSSHVTLGKGQPHELKAVLEEAVSRKLVTHNSKAMHDFLAKYGLSVDCSGYVSQALNHLVDGGVKVDGKDKLQPLNTGSGSLKGGMSNFTKVSISNVKEGDTMHVSGHIRIINAVVKDGSTIFFRTTESTASKNSVTGKNGLTGRWWKYSKGVKSYSWKNHNGDHPKATDKSWKVSREKNTFGRYKNL